jgi:UDP-GlcNAc:undecaprenyl-phosphate/decaprenyl-phosphate GlcNAc-1-phosphate transferase
MRVGETKHDTISDPCRIGYSREKRSRGIMQLLNLAIAAAFAAGVTLLLAPWAHLLRLVDHPGHRRIHLHATPRVGGLGISAGVLCCWALIAGAMPSLPVRISALLVLLIGLVDDVIELRPAQKLAAQLLIAAALAMGAGMALPYLGEVLPGYQLNLPWLGVPLAMLAYASLMNAINMKDGMDGLAGSVATVSFAGLGIAATLGGQPDSAWMAFGPAAAIVGFVTVNARLFGRNHALAFMGDSGSMLVGFLLASVAIVYTQVMGVVPPIVALWICALPLMDGLIVIVRRRLMGGRSTRAGCDHLHHLLLAKGMSVNAVVATEATAASVLAGTGIIGWQGGVPDWFLVLAFVATLIAYAIWTRRAWRLGPQPTLLATVLAPHQGPTSQRSDAEV